MNVLVVEPGFAPYEKEINGLKEMQETVGGLITGVYPYQEEIALVGNDESILLGMDYNRSVPGGYGGIFGPFFICGTKDGDFVSLTPAQMERFKKEYHHAEILLGANHAGYVTLKVEPKPHPSTRSPKRQQEKKHDKGGR